MKTRFKLVLLLVFVVILFTCCATTSAVYKLFGFDKPQWYYHPQSFASETEAVFVGEGISTGTRQAELVAYDNLKSKLESYLGDEISKEQNRRLTTLGTIEEYGLTIENRFSDTQKDGSVVYLIMATADVDKLQNGMSTEAKMYAEKAKSAVSLILEGDELIKKSQDLEGVRCYLKSLVYTYKNPLVEEEYSFDVIMEVVKDILLDTRIIVTNTDRESARCTVNVKRKTSIFYSPVKNSYIKASYYSSDSKGDSFKDSLTWLTSDSGKIEFRPIDYALTKDGKVVFSFDFDSEIEAVSEKSALAGSQLKRIVEEKAVTFTYFKEYERGPIVVCGLRFDQDGDFVSSEKLTDLLETRFVANLANVKGYYCDGNADFDYMIKRVSNDYPGSEYFLILKSGVLESVDSATGVHVVSVEGQAYLYRIYDEALIESTEILYTNGFGSTVEEATDNAFAAMAELAYSQIRTKYV